jgi:hypothetical protein
MRVGDGVGRLGCIPGSRAHAERVAGLACQLRRLNRPLPASSGRTRRPAAEGSRARIGEEPKSEASPEVRAA